MAYSSPTGVFFILHLGPLEMAGTNGKTTWRVKHSRGQSTFVLLGLVSCYLIAQSVFFLCGFFPPLPTYLMLHRDVSPVRRAEGEKNKWQPSPAWSRRTDKPNDWTEIELEIVFRSGSGFGQEIKKMKNVCFSRLDENGIWKQKGPFLYDCDLRGPGFQKRRTSKRGCVCVCESSSLHTRHIV